MLKKICFLFLLSALLTGCNTLPSADNSSGNIKNFDDCINAGYPAMESYPRQCAVPGGDTFTEVIAETDEEPDRLIGGDIDKHGCLVVDGYSWCEDKGKCLRILEEKCEKDPNAPKPRRNYDLIEEALGEKRGIHVRTFVLGIKKLTLSHFLGVVKDETGTILAAKRNNDWVIVYDGDGEYSCETVKPFNFPADMISDCK